jgi:predicted dehydrogenase
MTNWGIIGLGRIAQKFADDLRRLPDARLLAVASTDEARAKAFAEKNEAPFAFGRYEDLVNCPDLDVVYVANANTGHCAATLLCLEHDIAVLCEKPFSLHAAETHTMIETARRRKVFLMEALWTLFVPGVVQALDLARQGAIGRVHTVQADFGFYTPFDAAARTFNPDLGGGALLDIGIYPVLLAQKVFGAPKPADIWATATLAPTGVDAQCFAAFQYSDQRKALLQASFMAHTPIEAYIFGDTGNIRLHRRWHHAQQLTLQRYIGRETEDTDIQIPYEGWGYHFEAAHVMNCIDKGLTESPEVPLDFTMALTETLDAMLLKFKKPFGNG